jgi:hypothetical protein
MENNEQHKGYTAHLRDATDKQLETYNGWHALRLLKASGGMTTGNISLGLEAKLDDERRNGYVRREERTRWIFFTDTTYQLTSQGHDFLQQYERKIQHVKTASEGKSEALEGLLAKENLTRADYEVGQAVFVDKLYDNAAYGSLKRPSEQRKQEEYLQAAAKRKASEQSRTASSRAAHVAERRNSREERTTDTGGDTSYLWAADLGDSNSHHGHSHSDGGSHHSCGGHSHSCGGHSCGGSSCGGSSCGGGGCGGGD